MANTVRLDNAAIERLLKSQSGPLVRDLTLRAQRVTNRAKVLCPVDEGRLRPSIRPELRSDSRGLYAVVGTDVEYAFWVHEGTPAHVIERRGPLRHPPVQSVVLSRRRTALKGRIRTLKFPSTQRRGGFAFVRSVKHPGTRAVPFLRNALPAAA